MTPASPLTSLPRLSAVERLRVATTVLAPTLARGVIVRRPVGETVAGALDADRYAVRTLRRLRAEHGPGPVETVLFGRRGVVLLAPDQMRRVLEETPDPFTPANAEKRGALAHFQPHGVLISQGGERRQRRHFNEEVLDTPHRAHELAGSFVAVVREEARILDRALGADRELTWRRFAPSLWNVVRRVVLGDAARDDHRTTDLLRQLRSDSNWFYLRPRRDRLRAEFTERLHGHLERAEPGSLAAAIAATPAPEGTSPVDQVPQWLFAFEPAGIVAFRALALLAAHPEQAALVRAELAEHGASDPRGVLALERLRATVMESVRLWPTTLAILRDSTAVTEWDGTPVPADTAFVIFSAFFHRDPDRLPYAHRFAPEVWLAGDADDDGLVPFSGGPAECPGRNLVLFTTTALLAALLERREFRLVRPARLREPLPYLLNHFTLRLAGSPLPTGGRHARVPQPRQRTESMRKGATTMSSPTFIEVQKALSGADYPARRDELVEHARSNGAPEQVVNALRSVEDRRYDGPNEVSAAVSATTGGR